MFIPKNSPVIITGMHRSGTSMLTEFLEELGLFVGANKCIHNESTYFFEINRWLLLQSGGRWDVPEPFENVLEQKDLKNNFKKAMDSYLYTFSIRDFWGLKKYLKLFLGSKKENIKWGWKDPRNTITLPLWLEVFPDAKIIYIKRHGVDVAKSLRKRSQKRFNKTKNSNVPNYWAKAPQENKEIVDSPKTLNLIGGLKLWDYYLETFSNYEKNIDNEIFEITFEDILKHPQTSLPSIAKFCNLKFEDENIIELCENIKKSKKNSWKQNENLVKFARNHEAILKKHGYTSD